MEIDQGALFTFLGVVATALLGYLTIRVQQVHKLANDNLTKQTDLVAQAHAKTDVANAKIDALTEKVMTLLAASTPPSAPVAPSPEPIPVVIENAEPVDVAVVKKP